MEKITDDRWALYTVSKGLLVDLKITPAQQRLPVFTVMAEDIKQDCDSEVGEFSNH